MTAQGAASPKSNKTSANQKLKELGLQLPEAKAPPGALYVPYTVSGNQVIISGQLPFKDGKLVSTGQLGAKVTQAQGEEAARACAINVLAALSQACGGNLDKVKKALKLEILVSCTPEFTSPQLVANGASKLVIDLFGEDIGRHARVAYGVASLPLDASVEVAATFEIA
jgi:enamine deaminase RidA (YjgF/YER057c/UK114 family)